MRLTISRRYIMTLERIPEQYFRQRRSFLTKRLDDLKDT